MEIRRERGPIILREPKGSALTADVTKAVDALRDNGTLDELQQKWLSDAVDVPVLK